MPVKLYFAPTPNTPAGHYSIFNTTEEALAQAGADLAANREAVPIRIEAENGTVVHDKPGIAKAAG